MQTYQAELDEAKRVRMLKFLQQNQTNEPTAEIVEEEIPPIPAPFSIRCLSNEGHVIRLNATEFLRKVLKDSQTWKVCQANLNKKLGILESKLQLA